MLLTDFVLFQKVPKCSFLYKKKQKIIAVILNCTLLMLGNEFMLLVNLRVKKVMKV